MMRFTNRRGAVWGRGSLWPNRLRWPWSAHPRPPAVEAMPALAAAQAQGDRSEQQDRLFWSAPEAGCPAFALVADGMGGLAAGGVAADLTVDTARRMLGAPPADAEEAERCLARLCGMAHQRILQARGVRGAACGTTLAAVWVGPDWAAWGHVGDSRVYLIREGRVLHRTRDHSLAEWLVASGAIGEEDVASHPDQNKLTQCLGGPAAPVPAFGRAALKAGDALVLATDGVWVPCSEAALTAAARAFDPAEAARALVSDAVRAGAGSADNASVLILRPGSPSRMGG